MTTKTPNLFFVLRSVKINATIATIMAISVISAICLIATSCAFFATEVALDKCSLVVNVSGVDGLADSAVSIAAARTIVPGVALSAKSYDIKCTNSGGTEVASGTITTLSSKEFPDLAPGIITVTVNAYSDETTKDATTLVATGSATVTLTEGGASVANVALTAVQTSGGTPGHGTLSLVIEWPAASANQIWWYIDGIAQPTLTASSTPIAITTDSETGMSTVTLKKESLPSGVHTLRINFNKDGLTGTGSQLEIVNIYDNLTSDRWVTSDGTLAASRVYTAAEVMSMADSVEGSLTLRVLAGDDAKKLSLSASGTTTCPITAESVTVIPSAMVSGQSISYSTDDGTTWAVIASDTPLSFSTTASTATNQSDSVINPTATGRNKTVMFSVTAANHDAGGIKTYTIALRYPVHVDTFAELASALGSHMDNNVVLDANIDANYATNGYWYHVGTESEPFTGMLEGNNYTISGMTTDVSTIYDPTPNPLTGMFGKLGPTGVIKNLHLTGLSVTGTTNAHKGGLVSYNCGTIWRCSTSGIVTGDVRVGGLVGRNDGTVSECWSNASVTGSYAGGLVGENYGTIENSYARGIQTTGWGGGLLGWNRSTGIVRNCYAASLINQTGTPAYIQGLVGRNDGGAVADCFYESSKIGTSYSNGAAITSGYFGTATNYLALRTAATLTSWNYGSVWTHTTGKNGGFPHLRYNTPTEDTAIAAAGMAASDFQTLIESNLNGDYYLSASALTLSGTMTSIGSWNAKFSGVFDGRGHVIANALITGDSNGYAALFGYICGAVVNLNLRNVSVKQGVDQPFTGGLAGVSSGTLYRCSSTGYVSGFTSVGGIAGENYGIIRECYSSGAVYGRGNGIGGIVGFSTGEIRDCYARCTVSGTTKCGGVIGSQSCNLYNTYAAGIVIATDASPNSGGFRGYAWGGTVSSCFYDSSLTSGGTEAAAATPTPTANMKNLATFTGWDTSVWAVSSAKNSSYPYLINNAPEDDIVIPGGPMTATALVSALTSNPSGSIVLQSSITLTGNWPEDTTSAPFNGLFDGNGYTISGLKISSDTDNIALFRAIGPAGIVQNLNMTAVSVPSTGYYVAAIAQENKGLLYRCSAKGSVSGNSHIGGLVGDNSGIIRECWSGVNVKSNAECGGLVGINGTGNASDPKALIVDCYATGTVTANYAGGLVGINTVSGLIRNSYASSAVIPENTPNYVQGLVANNSYNGTGTIENSYFDGAKTPTSYSGDSVITSGFNGKVRTTAEMKDTGATATNYSGWDFSKIWTIDPAKNNGYPYLRAWTLPNDIHLSGSVSAVTVSSQLNGNLNAIVVLDSDLALTGEWTPVGTATAPFTGIFDGGGHTITGLDIQISSTDAGLFAYSAGIIENVTVANASVIPKVGEDYKDTVATLVAINSGMIRRCAVTGTIAITGNGYIGAMAGINQGTISECYSTAPIDAHSWYAGGLVGANHGGGLIVNCYSRGAVAVAAPAGYTVQYIGGLVGLNGGSITRSYTTGAITTSGTVSKVGGLVGGDGGVTSSFYQTVPSGGNALGTQSSAMTTAATYTGVSWDLATTLNTSYIWGIDTTTAINGGYPYLQYFGANTVTP